MQAKSKSTRLDQAKELKKMVYFSNLVVQPLLEGIKPPTAEEIEAEKADSGQMDSPDDRRISHGTG